MSKLIALSAVLLVLVSATSTAQASGSRRISNTAIEKQIRSVFGPAHDDTAVCIATAESRGNFRWKPGLVAIFKVDAVSETGDYGLFQAHYWSHRFAGETVAKFKKRMSDFKYAVRWAHRLSRGGTEWRHWTGTYGQGFCHGLT